MLYRSEEQHATVLIVRVVGFFVFAREVKTVLVLLSYLFYGVSQTYIKQYELDATSVSNTFMQGFFKGLSTFYFHSYEYISTFTVRSWRTVKLFTHSEKREAHESLQNYGSAKWNLC